MPYRHPEAPEQPYARGVGSNVVPGQDRRHASPFSRRSQVGLAAILKPAHETGLWTARSGLERFASRIAGMPALSEGFRTGRIRTLLSKAELFVAPPLLFDGPATSQQGGP
jgi:hypothetical protein